MAHATWNARHVQPRIKAFQGWLSMAGAEVLQPTSAWEVVRFRDGDTTSIIYTNARGGVTFTGSSEQAWNAFTSGSRWAAATKRVKRQGKKARDRNIVTVRARDGDECFFCAQRVSEDTESIEHLVSVCHGGPNHLSNMFLAHIVCNQQANDLSAVEKIRRYHAARAATPSRQPDNPLPWEE